MSTVGVRCLCPPRADGTPRHDGGDTITLRDRLDFRQAVAIRSDAQSAASEGGTYGDIVASLKEGYVVHGIASWTLVDAKGKPVPVNRASIREYVLTDYDVGEQIADAADELYTGTVVLPLLMRASDTSPESQTAPLTLPTIIPGGQPPTPSKPSSTSTTRTAGTARTSRSQGGVSKPSQSSASVA